jgi:tricorn protease
MSQIDWVGIYQRYLPLVDRVSSRSEFSDLVWELQGELATSHCYELGGDYRPRPMYLQGSLGADFDFDEASGGWKIASIVMGDPWSEQESSPLARLGTPVKEGDVLLAINGRRLSRQLSPAEALVNLAHTQVTLTFAAEKEESPRVYLVKTIGDESAARYREWVNNNRRFVHDRTGGKVGYIHIPDMGPNGYAEFHRGYLAEIEREGLIVDVRFNQGGYVSELLLEKLARRRIGVAQARWIAEPYPYPSESAGGPMVALTNEFAGSDGDIFSHGFKLLGLGPLIGKRTWGGVIGIFSGHMLVDGSVTTQPEVAFWFKDVGWGVENYGTDPDIEVDIAPQDYAKGVDPQMERAIEEVIRQLAEKPPLAPDLSQRPNKTAPKLPER